MPKIPVTLLDHFIFCSLTILLAASSVAVASVPKICGGRIEIGHQHEGLKVYYLAEVKRDRSNLTKESNSYTHHPHLTHLYQHVKKQPKRIWHKSRLSKKQHKVYNMLWTKINPLFKERVEKLSWKTRKYNKTYSAPSKHNRVGRKIKRQDDTNYSLQPLCHTYTTTVGSFVAFDYLEKVPKNMKSKEKLAGMEKVDGSKIPCITYMRKKMDLPRLAPFTSKTMRTPPPLMELSKSNNVNNLNPKSEGKRATKKNPRRKISFYWVSENSTFPAMVTDRIKFFETYDQYTASGKRKKIETGGLDNLQVRLVDVDQDIQHADDNYFYSKKAVKRDSGRSNAKENKNLKANVKNTIQLSGITIDETPTVEDKCKQPVAAAWGKYPFVAVYIYEPSQVHCDAAALSPHWLVTAGACLYRHHRYMNPGGHSPFVTYCGPDWRAPERIAYVNYSIVHPDYHPRDRRRRRLYNIGLVRVVNSLQASCPGWAPVMLMRNQFVASPKGSPATALGWGLDRYAGLESTTDLAKLMQYDGKIYSEECPGNSEYKEIVDFTIKSNLDPNVFCLTLPRRTPNEEEDSTHGSLLLSGGKLIGLYLEEEQRQWAEPSAQYTSVWRLVPWIQMTALETGGAENITVFDI